MTFFVNFDPDLSKLSQICKNVVYSELFFAISADSFLFFYCFMEGPKGKIQNPCQDNENKNSLNDNLFTTSELPKYSNSNCPNFVYFIFLLDQKQDQPSAAPSITLFTVPQKKCVFQKNQNKKNWRIGLFGGSDVVNKLQARITESIFHLPRIPHLLQICAPKA